MSLTATAQNATFKQVPGVISTPQQIAEPLGITDGRSELIDVDGDNDSDLILIGAADPYYFLESARGYKNDGMGNFTVYNTGLVPLKNSHFDYGDIDGDGDLDIISVGTDVFNSPRTVLSKNLGSGIFITIGTAPLEPVTAGSVSLGDIDGDGDLDLFVSGINASSQASPRMYINDGIGNFSQNSVLIEGLVGCKSIFFDVDNDGDLDLLISGSASTVPRTILYKNNGLGSFTEYVSTGLPGLLSGSFDFYDINSDGNLDILLQGVISGSTTVSRIYNGNGNGGFTQQTAINLTGIRNGDAKFVDIDNDSDKDIIQTGTDASGEAQFYRYINDGVGNFSGGIYPSVKGGQFASISTADIDGDGWIDICTSGDSQLFARTNLHLNTGTGDFMQILSSPVATGIVSAHSDFSDIDNDGDLDFIMTGTKRYQSSGTNIPIGITQMYRNDGNNQFYLVPSTPFDSVTGGQVKFGDVNNDTFEDVILSGSNITKLYINTGTGQFIEQIGTPFIGVQHGELDLVDFNNDGFLDLLMTGLTSTNLKVMKLYLNNGSGSFLESFGQPFEGVYLGGCGVNDIDGDGDMDILITGVPNNNMGSRLTRIYRNNGTGQFTSLGNGQIEHISSGSVNFFDFDNDGDQDVLINGETGNFPFTFKTRLYKNNGLGTFTLFSNTPAFTGTSNPISVSDVDKDGYVDIFYLAANISPGNVDNPITKLYKNNNGINFTHDVNFPINYSNPLELHRYGVPVFADWDLDGDDDLLCFVQNVYEQKTRLFENTTCYSIGSYQDSACLEYTSLNTGITHTNSGSFTEIIPNAEGCDSIITLNLTLTIPFININSSNGTLYTNFNGATFQWIECLPDGGHSEIIGETNNTFSPQASGSYAVIISVGNCSDTSACKPITFVGVEKQLLNTSISLYPNPAHDILQLKNEGPKAINSVELHSLVGKVIKPQIIESTSNSMLLDITALAHGVYLIRVKFEGDYYFTESQKFIK